MVAFGAKLSKDYILTDVEIEIGKIFEWSVSSYWNIAI